jgi:membrane-associated phospholipid phosphatase
MSGIRIARPAMIMLLLLILLFMPPRLYAERRSAGFLLDADGRGTGISSNRSDSVDIAEQGSSNSWFRRKYVRSSALLLGGAAMFAMDGDVKEVFLNSGLHRRAADRFFEKAENFGHVEPYLLTIPVLMGHGLFFHNKKSIRTAGELAGGLVLAQGLTAGAKKLFGRKRPYESDSPYSFFKGGSSFYSGHTITAFTFARVISKEYPHQNLKFIGLGHRVPLVPIVSYSIAATVGLQRLYSNVHWSSDVYFGALAGICAADLTAAIIRKADFQNLLLVPGQPPRLLFRFLIG